MARRTYTRTVEVDPDNPTVVDQAMEQDQQTIAEELGEALTTLSGMGAQNVGVLVYKVNKMRGAWEFVKELPPQFDTTETLEDLRDNWGAGQYSFRVRADGRIKTTKFITLATSKNDSRPKNGLGDTDLLKMMMEQSDRSKADQQNMFMMMTTQMQNSSQQMMAMMQNSNQMMVSVLTAAMGNKDSAASILTAMGQAQALFNPKGNGMGETLELIKQVKDIFPSPDGGGDDDNWAGLAKSAMPLLSSTLETIRERRSEQTPLATAPMPPQRIQLGVKPPAPINGVPVEQDQTLPLPLGETDTTTVSDPILSIIADDIQFMARRQYHPELAADVLYDLLQTQGVTIDALLPLILDFQQSENWLERLLTKGIDLRQYELWSNQVLSLLVGLYQSDTDDNEPVTDTERPSGSNANASTDETPST